MNKPHDDSEQARHHDATPHEERPTPHAHAHAHAHGEPSSSGGSFPHEKLEGPWINIFDPLDPVVGFDPRFADDYLRDGAAAVVER